MDTLKIVCTSDTHGLHNEMRNNLPMGDVIVHAGDCTNVGGLSEIGEFCDLYSKLPYKYKILVPGNHDFGFQQYLRNIEKHYENSGIIFLQDTSVEIEGIKIFGSPWTLPFMNWAFMKDEAGLEEVYSKIPQGCSPDIVVTHGPVYGYLDKLGPNAEHLGSKALLNMVNLHKPQYVIHGHIHGGYGKHKFNEHTTLVNVAICNEDYKPVNKPIVIEVKKGKIKNKGK